MGSGHHWGSQSYNSEATERRSRARLHGVVTLVAHALNSTIRA